LLPWLINILVLFPNFFLASNTAKIEFFKNYDVNFENTFLDYLGAILSFAYLTAEVYYIVRYRKLLLENFTDKNAFKNYNWLKQLTILLFIGQVLTLIKSYIRTNSSGDTLEIVRIIVLLFGVFFICWLFLKAVNSPKLFKGVEVGLKTSQEIKFSKEDLEISQQIFILKDFMSAQKPYLNPSLTIRNLAQELKMNSRDLSVLINQNLNQHFFDFVNEYRIEEAKNTLKNPAKTAYTILEILYEVGFNSKSSFNTAFKKHTGDTPTEFRKKHINS
jgi:AraC-like DNA-binding protein